MPRSLLLNCSGAARGLLSRGPLARARGRSGALSARHGRPCGAPSREPAWFRGKAGRQPAAAQRGTHLQVWCYLCALQL